MGKEGGGRAGDCLDEAATKAEHAIIARPRGDARSVTRRQLNQFAAIRIGDAVQHLYRPPTLPFAQQLPLAAAKGLRLSQRGPGLSAILFPTGFGRPLVHKRLQLRCDDLHPDEFRVSLIAVFLKEVGENQTRGVVARRTIR